MDDALQALEIPVVAESLGGIAAEAEPAGEQGSGAACPQHHDLVVSPEMDELAALAQVDEEIDHSFGIGAAIDVVAERDQGIILLDLNLGYQGLEGREAAMDIADREDSHDRENGGGTGKCLIGLLEKQADDEDGDDNDGHDATIVDATAFFVRDVHGVAARLTRLGEGSFQTDDSRSVIYLPRTRAFPDNTEVEAIVTLVGEPTGQHLPSVMPDRNALTVHVHHSLIRLPDDNYEPLPYDPRSGVIGLRYDSGGFLDYATPIGDSLVRDYGRRHRLEKVDPKAAVSEAVEPIVYYLDRGAPEPVRSALLEGARWWAEAFEAAGIKAREHVYIGDPDEEIEKAAKDCQATMIVLGSSAKAAWVEKFLGSTPRKIAEDTIYPTLLIPPEKGEEQR